MGDAVLADPQGQKQLSVAAVRLNETFRMPSTWRQLHYGQNLEGPRWSTSQDLARRAGCGAQALEVKIRALPSTARPYASTLPPRNTYSSQTIGR
jgi:hypothetical protein